ncbi:phytoene/squalene synthase family protein [Enterococcus sp. LJL90]
MIHQFEIHQKDFLYCEEIIKKASKTFYAAFSQLPEQQAWSIYAVYAFCREADDLIDEDHDIEGLYRLEGELKDFEANKVPDRPLWRALSVVFLNYDMDIQAFYDMLAGQKQDADFKQPQTQAELSQYAYNVAGSVGLMLLPILSDNWREIIPQGKKLGEALQITNILRDIGEDYENGRIYLPAAVMKRYGLTEEMLAAKIIGAELISVWEDQAAIAEKLYVDSLKMMPNINPEARSALLAASYYYREILVVVRNSHYQVFSEKPKVSHLRKLSLLAKIHQEVTEIVEY